MKKIEEQRILDDENLLRGLVNHVKILRSNIENPGALERSIEHNKKTIEKLQAQIDRDESSLVNGQDELEATLDRITVLREKVAKAKNQEKINKLLALQQELLKLES